MMKRMKQKNCLRVALTLIALIMSLPTFAIFTFNSGSQLDSGKWIKVFVDKTGIYEITYEQLREMGFENPERVSVYGKGGRMLPATFTDRYLRPMFTDGLANVGVIHSNGKLFFYGEGTSSVVPSTDTANPYFVRESKNIYTDEGVYFLTDKDDTPAGIPYVAKDYPNAGAYTEGIDYCYHEDDQYQNSTNTGQLFWGESFIMEDREYEWPVDMQYRIADRPVSMECIIYASSAASADAGQMEFGVRGAQGNMLYDLKPATSGNFTPQTDKRASLEISDNKGTVYVKAKNPGDFSFLNLDYWILTYPKSIPNFMTADENTQQRIHFYPLDRNGGRFTAATDRPLIALDVSDHTKVTRLKSQSTDDGLEFTFPTGVSPVSIVMFDPTRSQYVIERYEDVKAPGLRPLAEGGADMLIIAPDYMDAQAQRIADLHTVHDKMVVKVVHPSDIFNEFGGGIPDPMAYRSMVKLISGSNAEVKLKNILFLGPLYSDYRQAVRDAWSEGHIAYQEPTVTATRDASNAMDYYGMTGDFVHITALADERVNVGVGVLPVSTIAEAETAIDKIEEYVTETDFAMVTNEMLFVSCPGDDHIHDNQIVQSASALDNYSPTRFVKSTLCIDAFGYKKAQKMFLDHYNRGKLFTIYLGHGGSGLLTQSYDFFTNGVLMDMKNRHLGFIYVGGCDLTYADKGEKGMGTLMVTDASRGFVGAIVSSRTTWSGQNKDLGDRLTQSLFRSVDNPDVLREKSPTIGEVYADAKSLSTYSNGLCYLLIGDPALRLPVAVRAITLQLPEKFVTGQQITVKGQVLTATGEEDNNFNGSLVMKMMYPAINKTSGDVVTGLISQGKKVDVTYPDIRLLELRGDIKDGKFQLEFNAPAATNGYDNQSFQIYVASYDKENQVGASGFSVIKKVENEAQTGTVLDENMPVVKAEYVAATQSVRIETSDDHAFRTQAVRALVDGVQKPIITSASAQVAVTWAEYNLPVSDMANGKHTLTVHATDMAGNKNVFSYNFEKKEAKAPLTLNVEQKAAVGDVAFVVSGDTAGEDGDMTLEVADDSGKIIYTAPIEGVNAVWDSTSYISKGKVQLFRARVVAGSKYSEWLDFAAISEQ